MRTKRTSHHDKEADLHTDKLYDTLFNSNISAGSSFLMDIDIGWKSLCVESIFIGSTPIIANVSLADKDAHSKLVDHVTDVYVGVECWCWCYIAW